MTSNRKNMHTLASTIRFFKIITRTSLEDGKLRIPNYFTRKYGSDMSNPMFLNTPEGKAWKIYWTKHDGDILFQKGWKEFATYYSLDHGHMVLFEYDEKETSHFGVHIFDKSTLEIEYRFHARHDEQNNLDQKISDESVEILNELPQCKKTRVKSPMSCPQPNKKMRTDKSDDVGRSCKSQNLPKHVQVNEDMRGSSKCPKVEQEQLTSKIKEALNRARNFRSNYPSFTVVMKPSYLYSTFLHVSSQFVNKYLKKGKRDILLQVLDGRTWPSTYCLGRIRNGWNKFVSDNNLKLGDVCVFELTNSQALTLKVLIFPLGEEPHYPPPQESMLADEVNPLDPAIIPDFESKPIITSKGGKAANRTSIWTKPHSFIKAEEEANNFTSENPSFTVNIKQAKRREIRTYISIVFIRSYLDKKQILTLRIGKKFWHVKLFRYPYETSGRLGRGWQPFVVENKLQVGDACVFELINREDAVFDVHIFRGHS